MNFSWHFFQIDSTLKSWHFSESDLPFLGNFFQFWYLSEASYIAIHYYFTWLNMKCSSSSNTNHNTASVKIYKIVKSTVNNVDWHTWQRAKLCHLHIYPKLAIYQHDPLKIPYRTETGSYKISARDNKTLWIPCCVKMEVILLLPVTKIVILIELGVWDPVIWMPTHSFWVNLLCLPRWIVPWRRVHLIKIYRFARQSRQL